MFVSRSKIHAQLDTKLKIDPLVLDNIGDFAIDLHIGTRLYVLEGFVADAKQCLDVLESHDYKQKPLNTVNGMILKPNNVYLIETKESILSRASLLFLTLNQNIARQGFRINSSVADVGSNGKLLIPVTVEIPIKIYPNVPFIRAQLVDAGAAIKPSYKGFFADGKVENKKLEKELVNG